MSDRKHQKRHRGESPTESEKRYKKSQKHRRDKDRSSRHHDSDESDGDSRSHQRSKHRDRPHRDRNYDPPRRDRDYDPPRRDRDFDPHLRIKQEKDEHNFNEQQRERSHHDRRRRDNHQERQRGGGDFGMNRPVEASAHVKQEDEEKEEEEEKQKPNMELTGKLTEDTNTFRGVVIKYNEPQEAMLPRRKWRLYPFKGDQSLPVLHIHRQSAYLLGRDRKIADIPVDHPSNSKQHAVLQFRAMPYTRPDGSAGRRVRPYIIDLESANGTYLNGDRLEARRYYELKEKDVLKFGFSTREYVVLHDAVDTSEVNEGEDMEEA